MPISELKLAKELIRCPSVTPKDAGAINILAKNLRSLGFKCQLINFKNIKNLYAKLGKSSPNFCYAGHTDVVPPGNIKDWSVNPFKPTIIEDNCFIGARAEIAEGVIVGKGSVLSMGVYIGASTRIIDRTTGEVHYGKVPDYSVVVPGAMPSKNNPDGPSLYCVIIVKKVDEKTRSKTSINDLLRD